jgi:hypothetical protein
VVDLQFKGGVEVGSGVTVGAGIFSSTMFNLPVAASHNNAAVVNFEWRDVTFFGYSVFVNVAGDIEFGADGGEHLIQRRRVGKAEFAEDRPKAHAELEARCLPDRTAAEVPCHGHARRDGHIRRPQESFRRPSTATRSLGSSFWTTAHTISRFTPK